MTTAGRCEKLEKELADIKANSVLITKRERGIPNPILDEAEIKRTLTPDPTVPGLMKEEWEVGLRRRREMWDELEEIEKRMEEPNRCNLAFGGMLNGLEGRQVIADLTWLISRVKCLQSRVDDLEDQVAEMDEATYD